MSAEKPRADYGPKKSAVVEGHDIIAKIKLQMLAFGA